MGPIAGVGPGYRADMEWISFQKYRFWGLRTAFPPPKMPP